MPSSESSNKSKRVKSRTAAKSVGPARAAVCEALAKQRLLAFDYHGEPRVVAPYCHGVSTRGSEVLRAIQLRRQGSASRTGGFGFGKLWNISEIENVKLMAESFAADDPHYNPNDSAMAQIHCRVRRA